MQIRTFTGATLVEALVQVKQELGEEAIILTSRRAEDTSRLPDGHQVEVVAALPAPIQRRQVRSPALHAWSPPRINRDGSLQTESRSTAAQVMSVEEPGTAIPPATIAIAPNTSRTTQGETSGDDRPENLSEFLHLKSDLLDLRRTLRDFTQHTRFGAHHGWSERQEQALRMLDARGVSRAQACILVDELASKGDEAKWERSLLDALARRLPCTPREEATTERRVEALVGPTGVGKTTLLAKLLLNRAGLSHRRAGMLSLDTKRVAAVEQIRRLAGILKAPLELVYRPSELAAALERLSGCDLILVDTPGTGPRERLGMERTRAFLKEIKPSRIHAVVPASMRLEDQLAAIGSWRQAGADRLIISKLDEAANLGGLVDLAEQAGLPLSWGGTGQRIPDDLVRLDSMQLARWIWQPESLPRDGESRMEVAHTMIKRAMEVGISG